MVPAPALPLADPRQPAGGDEVDEPTIASAERDRTLVELAQDLVWELDASGRVTAVNARVLARLGRPGEAIVGRPLEDGLLDTERDALRALLAHDDPGEHGDPGAHGGLETAFLDGGGRPVWVRLTVRHLTAEDGRRTASLAVGTDVTDLHAASGALRLSEARLRDVLSTIPVGVIVYDATGAAEFANASACEIIGRPIEEIGEFGVGIMHPDDADGAIEATMIAAAAGETAVSEVRFFRPDGSIGWLSCSTVLRSDEVAFGQGGCLIVFSDITARKEAEAERDRFFETAVEMQLVATLDGRLVRANPAWVRAFGRASTGTSSLLATVHPDDVERVREEVHALASGGARSFEVRCRRREGDYRWVDWTAVADLDRGVLYASGRDVTDSHVRHEDLTHQASHDQLTGLANRSRFGERLERSLRRLAGQPSGTALAVMFLDLDGFKFVNDSLGHGAGDALLTAVARRLEEAVRPSDTVARHGGDEFVILCDNVADVDQVLNVAQRITRVMAEPFTILGRPVYVSASVGVTVADATRTATSGELLSEADSAAYRAKENGKARFELYDHDLRARAEERLTLETALRQADARDLVVEYRPVVDLHTASVVSFEAVLEWDHPAWGRVPRDRWTRVAEDSGLVVPIGQHLLDQVCRQGAAWSAAGVDLHWIAVPVSPRQFGQPDFVDSVARALEASGAPPALVSLGIPETALMRDVNASITRLEALRALGVRLAIDDFGAGSSSLNFLRRFPVDVVNVDRTFTCELGSDAAGSAIVAAVIGLAHVQGLQVVAEGVETVEHLAALFNLACDLGQGSYFGNPLPADGARALLG
jgi:diguanylate cyclase (GGDEF)-like protein/PAS domain S-box-containing protein